MHILPGEPESIVLRTTGGFEVPNEVGPPMADSDKLRYERVYDSRFPDARRWTRPTSKYNCFGMAIANRWTHIEHWQSVDHVLRHEYEPISEREAVPGDLVAYREGGELIHLGIISRVESLDLREQASQYVVIHVLSKWGPAAEYEHKLEGCPYGGRDIEYWRAKGKENRPRPH